MELARRLAAVELAPRLAVALVGSLAAELAGRLAVVELTPSLAAALASRLAAELAGRLVVRRTEGRAPAVEPASPEQEAAGAAPPRAIAAEATGRAQG